MLSLFFYVSMKIGSAPRGSTFTILPPAVVMAANNYYGLPQVWEVELGPDLETLCRKVVHGQPTVGQYTAAATAYPAPAPGTAVPVGYSAAAAASAATSYAAARPAAPSVLPAAYSAYPQVEAVIKARLQMLT